MHQLVAVIIKVLMLNIYNSQIIRSENRQTLNGGLGTVVNCTTYKKSKILTRFKHKNAKMRREACPVNMP